MTAKPDWLSYFSPKLPAFPSKRLRAKSVCLQHNYKSRRQLGSELLKDGDVFASPGGQFIYRVVGGPVCLLYDREQLPWPSCSLDWRGKQPSWRRIGKRLIPDIAGKHSACYVVELLNHKGVAEPKVLSWVQLVPELKRWWYSIEMPEVEKQKLYQQERPILPSLQGELF
ncbi:MAG: hypothetical protein AB4050_18500 [Synechococcus sp.]